MKSLSILGVVLALLLAGCAAGPGPDSADCAGQQSLRIENAWARATTSGTPAAGGMNMATPPGGGVSMNVTSAAYLVISNCGSQPEKLLSAASDAAELTQIHQTVTENGVSKMMEVGQIEIPAGKKVELKPGGLHVMMMALKKEIPAGATVNLTLTFEKAGKIPVAATAKNP